jgi:hypothetical protein
MLSSNIIAFTSIYEQMWISLRRKIYQLVCKTAQNYNKTHGPVIEAFLTLTTTTKTKTPPRKEVRIQLSNNKSVWHVTQRCSYRSTAVLTKAKKDKYGLGWVTQT